MRRSEAERYAFRTLCFNRPDEARLIKQARQQIAPSTDTSPSPKPTAESQKPADPPKTPTWATPRRERRGWSSGKSCGY